MKKYVFKKYTKKSGTLTPFSLKFDIPFKTKRIFLIYGNKNFIRGDHAHFKCKQFGRVEIPQEAFIGVLKISKEKITGEVAERLKAHAWKACKGEILSWVRIPFSPPYILIYFQIFIEKNR